jgi:hypothetical protein
MSDDRDWREEISNKEGIRGSGYMMSQLQEVYFSFVAV